MPKVFLSLNEADKPFANQLLKSLKFGLGVEVWAYFANNINMMNWSIGVQEALDECDVMILITTPGALGSKHVRREWEYFYDNDKPIVLVKLQPIKVPYELNRFPFINFYDRDYNEAFTELSSRLGFVEIKTEMVSPASPCLLANAFWISHDVMELFRWLREDIDKLWLDVGFRQSCHHAEQLELSANLLNRMHQLRDQAGTLQEADWTKETRERYAKEVSEIYNIIAQEIQAKTPGFNSGPG